MHLPHHPPVHPYPPPVAWACNRLAMACSCASATGSCGASWRAAAFTATNTPKRSRNVAGCTMGGTGAMAKDEGSTETKQPSVGSGPATYAIPTSSLLAGTSGPCSTRGPCTGLLRVLVLVSQSRAGLQVASSVTGAPAACPNSGMTCQLVPSQVTRRSAREATGPGPGRSGTLTRPRVLVSCHPPCIGAPTIHLAC